MARDETLEYAILGPTEVRRAGARLVLGAAKPRALLVLLLLNANRVVSTDRLIEDLWGEESPATAQTTMQVYVLQLRRLLEPHHAKGAPYEVLMTTPPGYTIRVPPDALDLHRFERLAMEGVTSPRRSPGQAAATLREALELWRGAALADFAFEPFAQAPAARLEEMRLATLERRIEADLERGLDAELVGELQELCAEHPLREGLAAHLMLALYRAGRQAEALDFYQRTRRTLVDELGIDPGPALQRLEHDILVQDPALERTGEPSALPSGEVTFAFTDIEGSTELVRRLGDVYATVLVDYRRLVREAFHSRGGYEVDRQGDGLFYAFQTAQDAAAAAVECQLQLGAHSWPAGEAVRARIGLHTGTPTMVDDGYVGLDVHRAARIGSAAHGGQVLLSERTFEAVGGLPSDWKVQSLGDFALKGLADPEQLLQLVAPGLDAVFPTPRVASSAGVTPTSARAVLVVARGDEADDALLALAEQLAVGPRPRELMLAQLVAPSDAPRLGDATAALGARRDALAAAGVSARVAVFTSTDMVGDVVRLTARSSTDLVLLRSPDETLRDGMLGEELGGVLGAVLSDVAFLVGAGGDLHRVQGGPVLVPFGAGEHDWAALEVGAWLAANTDRPLHLLGMAGDDKTGARDASRLIADAGLLIQRAAGVAPVPRLVESGPDGPVGAAREGGLLTIGLSDQWSTEGLGMTRWAIAKAVDAPVLFVRRGLRPGGLAPDVSLTRFAWSVTAQA